MNLIYWSTTSCSEDEAISKKGPTHLPPAPTSEPPANRKRRFRHKFQTGFERLFPFSRLADQVAFAANSNNLLLALEIDNDQAKSGLTHPASNIVSEVENGNAIRLKLANVVEIDWHQDHGISDARTEF
jgi:hypothetical protein